MKSQLKLVFVMTLALGASNYTWATDASSAGTSSNRTAVSAAPVQVSNPVKVRLPHTIEESRAMYWKRVNSSESESCFAEIAGFPTEREAGIYMHQQMDKYPTVFLHYYPPYTPGANWTVMIAGAVDEETAYKALALAESLKIVRVGAGVACH